MLGICVPVRDTVHSGFSFCLAELTAWLGRENVNYKLYFENGSILPEQRNRLVASALKDKCTDILWLDSDMLFPPDVYLKLKKHKRPVVACNYSTRHWPFKSVAFTNKNDLSERLTERKGLHQVFAVGMGIMLVETKVFKKIQTPYFSFKYNRELESYTGEDVEFCKTLQDYDVKVFIDADTSEKCAHVGTAPRRLELIENA